MCSLAAVCWSQSRDSAPCPVAASRPRCVTLLRSIGASLIYTRLLIITESKAHAQLVAVASLVGSLVYHVRTITRNPDVAWWLTQSVFMPDSAVIALPRPCRASARHVVEGPVLRRFAVRSRTRCTIHLYVLFIFVLLHSAQICSSQLLISLGLPGARRA